MIHLHVRVFGRVYTLGHDDLWAERGRGRLWTNHNAHSREYHARSLVLWVTRAPHGARRFEWECGGLSVSF